MPLKKINSDLEVDGKVIIRDGTFQQILLANGTTLANDSVIWASSSDWDATTGTPQILNKPLNIGQTEAEDGISITPRIWTSERVRQAIIAYSGNIFGIAANISYDNTISKLIADNVQTALDEIDATIDEIRRPSTIIDSTYQDMKTRVINKTLVANQAYRIIDFITHWNVIDEDFDDLLNRTFSGSQESIDKYAFILNIEPIIITARSLNTFYEECTSDSYPNDILKYDIDINQLLVKENGTVINGYTGSITYRKDIINVLSADYDWRNIQWTRWALTSTTYNSATTYGRKSTCSVGDALYISYDGGNIGNAPTVGGDSFWIEFRAPGPDTSGLFTDYISPKGKLRWYENNLYGFQIDLTKFKSFYTFTFTYDLLDSSGVKDSLYWQGYFTTCYIQGINNIIMLENGGGVSNQWFIYNYNLGKNAFDNTFISGEESQEIYMGLDAHIRTYSNYFIGRLVNVNFQSREVLYDNYIDGVSFLNKINVLVTNILLNVNRFNTTRSSKEIIQWSNDTSFRNNIGTLKSINTTDTIFFINCNFYGNFTISGSNIGASSSKFKHNITNSKLLKLSNTVFNSPIIDVVGENWVNINIPSNVIFNNIKFNIPKWSSNVWSGNALTINDATVNRLYVGANDIVWYSKINENGIRTDKIIE